MYIPVYRTLHIACMPIHIEYLLNILQKPVLFGILQGIGNANKNNALVQNSAFGYGVRLTLSS